MVSLKLDPKSFTQFTLNSLLSLPITVYYIYPQMFYSIHPKQFHLIPSPQKQKHTQKKQKQCCTHFTPYIFTPIYPQTVLLNSPIKGLYNLSHYLLSQHTCVHQIITIQVDKGVLQL